MVTFRDAVASSLRGALCAVIAINDDGAKLFGRVLPPVAGAADYLNFFAPLRAQLCNDDPADTAPIPPPFTGGQCPGVIYNVNVTGTTTNPPQNQTFSANLTGPLSYSREVVGGEDCGPSGDEFVRFTIVGSTPSSILTWQGCGATFVVNSTTRLDGLPDDCGDPGIVVPPPGPITRPVNITYDTSDDDIIDIDGDVTFSPAFSVGELNVRVPFTLDLGGFTWTGNLQVSPSFELTLSPNINFGNGGATDDPVPPPTGDPGTPPPPDDDDQQLVIIGVVVRSTPTSELRQTEIATVGIPTIYAPRIASVSFAIESSFTVAWTPDTPVKNRDCYIPCPAVQGAVGVSVSPEPGWECSFVAVRGLPANAT